MIGNHMRSLLVAIFAGIFLAPGAAAAEGWPAEPMKTLEDIEDIRLLFCSDAYRIHELETLITYAVGFGAEKLDANEPYEWHRESLEVFEFIKSVDDAGQDMRAFTDFAGLTAATESEDLELIGDLRNEAARRVLEFHARLDARVAAVREQLAALSAAKGLAEPQVHDPIPWPEPQREIGRKMGFTPAWYMWLNQKTDSARAALDRQQAPLDNSYLLYKAAKIGIRAIVPEFAGNDNEESCSWRVVEPEEGKYDFSRIDSNIELIAVHGLKTVIPIRSFSTDPPEWAQGKFGDASRIWRFDLKENKAAPGTGVNLFDPATRGAFLDYVAALARHLRETHAGDVIAVSLETKMTRLPAEVDYSPAAVRHFRTWMQTTYGKIETVNELWGAELRSFDELAIPLPRMEAPDVLGPNRPDAAPLTEAAKWQDWIAWRKAWLSEYFAMQADVIRRELPGVPIQAYAIEANSHEAHSERPVWSWPLQMGTLADVPSSCATVEPVQVLLRRVGGGRFTGVQAEQNFGSMLGGCAYAGFLKDALYSVARDGADVILRYFYAPGLYGYMDRQLNWDGAYSFRLKMREMHSLAPLIENTRSARTSVALLWSENSYDHDPTVYSRWGALGTAYAMMCAKVHYDIVLEADVQRGELANYSLLIVPEQRYLMEATLEPIRQFVRNGGTVFATGVPGMFDERGRDRGQPLADVFGADLKAFTPIQAVPGTMLVPTRPNSIWGDRERGADRGRFLPDEWSLRLQLAACFTPREGAEVLHSFADGTAAMIRNTFGNGSAVILGYPFGHEYAYSNPTEMSFGKIYPHFSYPPQMTALENWLGRFIREQLKHAQPVQVPKSWMDRFTGRERSGPSLTYPGLGDTYENKRLETDAPNHSLAIGLRERDGIGTTYLTVFNRDSAYAVNRGYIHYMASPTHTIIRLNRTDVRAIYDVVNRCYVPFV
ncbi:MAG TPA: beta-galactosidase, partial [Planctomycetota bacterium]|nr:beta-galactosidase [Planctomycetota bacterium]